MTKEEIFGVWAPSGSRWSPWAAPALFAHLNCVDTAQEAVGRPRETGELVDVLPPGTALVFDVAGEDSVIWGVEVATRGWRPVPLFNNAPGPGDSGGLGLMPTVSKVSVLDMSDVVYRICRLTQVLAAITLPDDAPPAFLLDSRRLTGTQVTSDRLFDNRWMVFPQDFPSAGFLHSHGIRRVVLVQAGTVAPMEDLSHTLLRWQDAGIEIWAKDLTSGGPGFPIKVSRPSRYKAAWYRALAMLGLRRNSAGGFGSFLPEPWSAG
jgi:hypothetical protein